MRRKKEADNRKIKYACKYSTTEIKTLFDHPAIIGYSYGLYEVTRTGLVTPSQTK